MFKFLRSSYSSVKAALAKSRSLLGTKLKTLFGETFDYDTIEQLEELLYEADLGVDTAVELSEKVAEVYKKNPKMTGEQLIDILRQEIHEILTKNPSTLNVAPEGPTVIFVVGVNGNGKTSVVGKLAHYLKSQEKTVLVGAADTFRAAAIDQLDVWAQRAGVDIVKGMPKADPAAVVFDTITAAKTRAVDAVIIDTAGRLQAKTALMQELEKMKRSCKKVIPSAPHETLLVIDATTGQNGIDQAKTFNQYTPITGLILTKLDGSAKGGVAIAIQKQLDIGIKFIGTGEDLEDLIPFDAKAYVDALLE